MSWCFGQYGYCIVPSRSVMHKKIFAGAVSLMALGSFGVLGVYLCVPLMSWAWKEEVS